MSSSFLISRQNDGRLSNSTETDDDVPFWWTRTGVIVKWSIFLGFSVLFMAWIIGGYMHAKRRMRKGLKPLGYHRCLVSRAELARVDPAYAYPQATYYAAPAPGYYSMQPMPPPVYDPNRPPMYPGGPTMAPPPPQGANKIDPQQAGNDYAPPPGPPPPAAAASQQQAQRTGGSNNPFADPPRL